MLGDSARLLKELEGIARGQRDLREAEEVELSELPAEKRKAVEALERKLKVRPSSAWEGIHGTIVSFAPAEDVHSGRWRLNATELKAVAAVKGLRWAELDAQGLTIGF